MSSTTTTVTQVRLAGIVKKVKKNIQPESHSKIRLIVLKENALTTYLHTNSNKCFRIKQIS